MPKKTVYITTEQAARLAALACDAAVGVQFDADDSDNTSINGCFVPIDRINSLEFFEVDPDGTLRMTT